MVGAGQRASFLPSFHVLKRDKAGLIPFFHWDSQEAVADLSHPWGQRRAESLSRGLPPAPTPRPSDHAGSSTVVSRHE